MTLALRSEPIGEASPGAVFAWARLPGEPRVSLSWALDWLDTALALAEENRELRRILSHLLFARDRDLRAWARAEIEGRFPEEAT